MYSTVNSLHIALDARLQQLNSNRKQSIRPEQYDMACNDALLTIVKQRCSPKLNSRQEGFEESIKRYDDLKSLKRELNPLVYVSNGEQFYNLPSDYLHYITSKGNIQYNRKGLLKETLSELEYKTIVDFSNIIFDGTIIDYTLTDNSHIRVPIFGQLSKSDKSSFYYFNIIREYFKSKYNIDVYYENYNTEYYPKSLIFITRDINKKIVNCLKELSTNIPIINTIISKYSFKPITDILSYVSYNNKKIDLISSQSNNTINNDYFLSKNSHLNPTCIIQGNKVSLRTDNTFSFTNVVLEYIKYPRLIDSRINQMTDVEITDEILDIATTNLSGILKDETFKINSQKEQQNN